MDIHYNAFISYRHHPDDIRVAAQIHRLLEHYRIPRALRKQSKGITRLFRDKEELPITSNLTEDITRALENSDFLIVICSTHTRESTWVRREIETFLKTHDRSRVLTVLADGDPYETIPELLLREERVIPETGEVEFEEIEPLSCDWRLPLRQARREELPRLAAALLGCGYDELRRRERQYRTRRLMAGCSAALAAMVCITGYVLYNSMRIQDANDRLAAANGQLELANVNLENANLDLEQANAEIQANLNEALMNQSQYLASSAGKLLEEGDRMTALAIALDALPKYSGERPYVAAAEYALAAAVGAYQPVGTAEADGCFHCDALVRNFRVSNDGGLLYIADARDILSVWDTVTFEKKAAAELICDADLMWGTREGNLLTQDQWEDILVCYSPEGTVLWSRENSVGAAFLGDGSVLMTISQEMDMNSWEYIHTLIFLNPDTGESVREPITLESGYVVGFLQEQYDEGSVITIEGMDDGYCILAVDPEKEATTLIDRGIYYLNRTAVTADGNVLALMTREQPAEDRGKLSGWEFTGASVNQIVCYTPDTGRILWETEFTSYEYSSITTLEVIPGSDNIFCQESDMFLVLDGKSGEILGATESVSAPLYVQVNDSYVLALLEDGTAGNFWLDDYSWWGQKYLPDTLTQAASNGGFYVLQDLGARVTVYRNLQDENFREIPGDYSVMSYEWQTFGDYLVFEDYRKLWMFDTAEQTLLWCAENSGKTELLGFTEDGGTLVAISNRSLSAELLELDVLTGERKTTPLPMTVGEYEAYPTGSYGMQGDAVLYITECYVTDGFQLFRYDRVTGEFACCDLDAEVLLLETSGSKVIAWCQDDGRVLEICPETGSVCEIAADVAVRPAVYMMDDGESYLLGMGKQILHCRWGGEICGTLALGDWNAASVCVFEDVLLVLGDDGDLYAFDAAGNRISRTGTSLYSSFSNKLTDSDFDPSQISWSFTEDGSLLLNIFGMGNLIDCGSWQLRAEIGHCYGYFPRWNGVAVTKTENNMTTVGLFPLYSTEEIMDMARDSLNGFELTQAQRMAYGLD